MLLPRNLQTVLDAALLEVQSHLEHQLSAETRIKIYIAFGEYDSNHNLERKTPIRGHLALITARRVIHIWDDIGHFIHQYFGITGRGLSGDYLPLSDPQKVHFLTLMVSEDYLSGYVPITDLYNASEKLYYISDSLIRYVNDLIETMKLSPSDADEFYYRSVAVRACYRVIRDVYGFRHIPIITRNDRLLIEDTAHFAMLSECGKDKTKALKFWTWWLSEAIPQTWEKVYGTVKL